MRISQRIKYICNEWILYFVLMVSAEDTNHLNDYEYVCVFYKIKYLKYLIDFKNA